MTGATAPTSSVGSPKTVAINVLDGVIVQVSLPAKRLLDVSRSRDACRRLGPLRDLALVSVFLTWS